MAQKWLLWAPLDLYGHQTNFQMWDGVVESGHCRIGDGVWDGECVVGNDQWAMNDEEM